MHDDFHVENHNAGDGDDGSDQGDVRSGPSVIERREAEVIGREIDRSRVNWQEK